MADNTDDVEDSGPDPAGAIAVPRNPEDGTPMAPKEDAGREPHMTDELEDAIETPVEAGEEVDQP